VWLLPFLNWPLMTELAAPVRRAMDHAPSK
jgi:hypothetical protein